MRALKKPVLTALCLMTLWSQAAVAQSHLDTPLMVVRFNQARVYYQQPLFNAVSKAVEAKQAVVFTVVAVAPQTGNAQTDGQLSAQTRQYTGAVVADMVKMGIPQKRIRVQHQTNPGVASPEVHLFVE